LKHSPGTRQKHQSTSRIGNKRAANEENSICAYEAKWRVNHAWNEIERTLFRMFQSSKCACFEIATAENLGKIGKVLS